MEFDIILAGKSESELIEYFVNLKDVNVEVKEAVLDRLIGMKEEVNEK